jgi:ketosteroid isomerase-like protein
VDPALDSPIMDHKQRVQEVMGAMSQGRVAPLFEAMAEDVTWRWMGVGQWSRTFESKQLVMDKLFGGATETLGPSSSVEVRSVHADGDSVVVEHSGRNELPDGRRYDNNYCWVLRFRDGLIQEVREYMDTQLVTETFGADATG